MYAVARFLMARTSFLRTPAAWLAPAVLAASLLGACSRKEPAEEADAAAAAPAPFDAGVDAADAEADAPYDARAEEERAALLDAGRFCGKKDLPDCPMQAWMKRYASTMIGFGDIATIAEVFDKIGALVPDEALPDGGVLYPNWKSISRDGAAAARAGDIAAAKAACRGCHAQYRAKYHADFRARPIAEP